MPLVGRILSLSSLSSIPAFYLLSFSSYTMGTNNPDTSFSQSIPNSVLHIPRISGYSTYTIVIKIPYIAFCPKNCGTGGSGQTPPRCHRSHTCFVRFCRPTQFDLGGKNPGFPQRICSAVQSYSFIPKTEAQCPKHTGQKIRVLLYSTDEYVCFLV